MKADPYSQLRSAFSELDQIARSVGDAELQARAEHFAERVRPRTFSVAFVGEFKAGKSTLVNGLCRRELLPVATRECTAVVTRVRATQAGETEGVTVTLDDDSRQEGELSNLEGALSIKGGTVFNRKRVVEAEVRLSNWAWAEFSVELVDTPGVSAASKARDAAVLHYLPRADAIVFVTRADQLLSQSEQDFLKHSIVPQDVSKLFVVINRADTLRSDADRRDVEARAREILSQILDAPVRVLLTSAAMYEDGLIDEDQSLVNASGVPAFEQLLRDFLRNDRMEAELARARRNLDGLLDQAERGFRRMHTNASLGVERVRERAERYDRAIAQLRADGSRVSVEASALVEQVFAQSARSLISEHMIGLCNALTSANADQSDDVKPSELVSIAQDRLRLAGVALESLCRDRSSRIQQTVGSRLAAVFEGADADIDTGLGETGSMLTQPSVRLEDMLSVRVTEEVVQTGGSNRGATGRPTTGDIAAGGIFGGLVGAFLLGPVGFVFGAAWGMAAAADDSGTSPSEVVRTVRKRFKVQGIPDTVQACENQLKQSIEPIISRVQSNLSSACDRIVSSKLRELEHQRAQLEQENPAELENRRRESQEILTKLAAIRDASVSVI